MKLPPNLCCSFGCCSQRLFCHFRFYYSLCFVTDLRFHYFFFPLISFSYFFPFFAQQTKQHESNAIHRLCQDWSVANYWNFHSRLRIFYSEPKFIQAFRCPFSILSFRSSFSQFSQSVLFIPIFTTCVCNCSYDLADVVCLTQTSEISCILVCWVDLWIRFGIVILAPKLVYAAKKIKWYMYYVWICHELQPQSLYHFRLCDLLPATFSCQTMIEHFWNGQREEQKCNCSPLTKLTTAKTYFQPSEQQKKILISKCIY